MLQDAKTEKITIIDISKKSIDICRINSNNLGIFNRLKLFKSDIDNFKYGKYDLVISNPPYITKEQYANLSNDVKGYEPKIALTDNKDGLLFYNRFSEILNDILMNNGLFICEISATIDTTQLRSVFLKNGIAVKIFPDINNKNRVLVGSIIQ